MLFFFSSRSRHTRCAFVTGVDVCSSVLRGCLPFVLSLRPPRGGPAGSAGFIRRAENGGNGPGLRRFRDALGSFWGGSRPREEREIGRASCRERVCQYV